MSRVHTVGDVMSPPSLCLRPETTVGEAERRLGEGRVTGAPVVDGSGFAVGVISQQDLLTYGVSRTTADESGRFYTDVDDYREIGRAPVDRTATPVAEIMTRDVVCVDRETPIPEAAALLRSRRIHRVLVTDKGVLVGVATSLDLLEALEPEA